MLSKSSPPDPKPRSQSELDIALLHSLSSSLTVPSHLRLDEDVMGLGSILATQALLRGTLPVKSTALDRLWFLVCS